MSKELQRVFEHLGQARREVTAAIKCCESDARLREELKEIEETLYGELGDVLDRLETKGAA